MNEVLNKIAKYIETGDIKSPSYIFDSKGFAERGEAVKEALGPRIDICFSIKANPFLLYNLPEVFSKVEVCSPGELEICKALSIPPEKIVFSGVNKTRENVEAALEYGVTQITAESKSHINHVLESLEGGICQYVSSKSPISLLLRLSEDSQFGIDEEELVSLIKEYKDNDKIEITGIHFFTGTGKKKSKEIAKELLRLQNLIDRLSKEIKYIPKVIEYGPGLGIQYFPKLQSEEVSASVSRGQDVAATGGSISEAMDNLSQEWEMDLLRDTAPLIRDFAENNSQIISEFSMTVEMGRFFAAPCGYYLVKVADLKTNDDINYLIVDGGLHQLKYDGQLQGMKIPAVTHIKGKAPAPENAIGSQDGIPTVANALGHTHSSDYREWTVCGSLCTVSDVLVRNLPLESVEIGDYLLFHRTGAYSVTEGMSMFLSRDLPGVYAFDGGSPSRLITLRDSMELAYINTPSINLKHK